MRKFFIPAAAFVLAVTLSACGGRMSVAPPSAPSGGSGDITQSLASGNASANFVRVCGEPERAGYARCDSLIRTDIGGANLTPNLITPNFSGPYAPASLHSAYKLSTTAGTGQTIAIVDAFNDPTAESDMKTYRSHYGLTVCTTANGCFKKVNQNGIQGSYPPTDDGWAGEISLDLDMVSAICQHCKIILVETNDNTFTNLSTGVNRAVTMGANAVSNSYGGPESSFFPKAAYNHPGHIMTASAGDSGTRAQMPCSLATIVCVGGTSLRTAANARGWTETAWSGTGSGCSAKVLKPAWQHDPSCHMRSEADISAVADPNTGVIVYDTTPIPNPPGPPLTCTPGPFPNCYWVFGGTSASSPIIAGAYGLAGNAAALTAAQSIWTHGGTASFFDVTSGNNGSCAIFYICHAGPGYDGPTGWGTPDGVSGL